LLNTLRNNKGGSIRSVFLDNNRNYLFTGSYEDGEINVFDLDKPGK
jgi:6-phosphogluconolactonase (cycloisomerase 2 family)